VSVKCHLAVMSLHLEKLKVSYTAVIGIYSEYFELQFASLRRRRRRKFISPNQYNIIHDNNV